MNTLGKSITSTFFKSPADYLKLSMFWAQKMQSREKISAAHHALYMILVGRNWSKGFTLPKNFDVLYQLAYVRAYEKIAQARHTPQCNIFDCFREFLTDGIEEKILLYLPEREEIFEAIKQRSLRPYKEPANV